MEEDRAPEAAPVVVAVNVAVDEATAEEEEEGDGRELGEEDTGAEVIPDGDRLSLSLSLSLSLGYEARGCMAEEPPAREVEDGACCESPTGLERSSL